MDSFCLALASITHVDVELVKKIVEDGMLNYPLEMDNNQDWDYYLRLAKSHDGRDTLFRKSTKCPVAQVMDALTTSGTRQLKSKFPRAQDYIHTIKYTCSPGLDIFPDGTEALEMAWAST